MAPNEPLTDEQKQYLQGFVAGTEAARAAQGLGRVFPSGNNGSPAAVPPATVSGPEAVHHEARARTVAAGKTLVAEEQTKRDKHPFDMWDEMRANADAGLFPKGPDIFRYKFHGLFYVAPSQDAFMCRLRMPNGILTAHQFRGLADLAEQFARGYAHVTTRANLQIREIPAGNALKVLQGLYDLGLTSRGSGADNIRNVTGTPTAGIDVQELIDTRPLCKEWHHYILNHRELYGLPRKFNVAFDGAGTTAVLEDTNDIGFAAVRVDEGKSVPAGVYFRMQLGGITGHGDFARDTGVILKPEECTAVAAAVVRVFIKNGDRTNRTKARLKYLLDAWGFERFLTATEQELGRALVRLPLGDCEPRPQPIPHAHVGIHPQRQPSLSYVGVVLPVGKLTSDQMRGLADLASRQASGTVRLTVWQNLLISDVPENALKKVCSEIESLGLQWNASSIRAGLVACTGNTGCKFSASDTKRHALAIADSLEPRVTLDQPINIHLTGCHHSCAQHYVGDIGLLATKIEVGDEQVEGYHLYVGGGAGVHAALAREVMRDIPADDVPGRIEDLLRAYLSGRKDVSESFCAYTRRQEVDTLRSLFHVQPAAAD
jgi:ferredoxin-nitrite reductase